MDTGKFIMMFIYFVIQELMKFNMISNHQMIQALKCWLLLPNHPVAKGLRKMNPEMLIGLSEGRHPICVHVICQLANCEILSHSWKTKYWKNTWILFTQISLNFEFFGLLRQPCHGLLYYALNFKRPGQEDEFYWCRSWYQH